MTKVAPAAVAGEPDAEVGVPGLELAGPIWHALRTLVALLVRRAEVDSAGQGGLVHCVANQPRHLHCFEDAAPRQEEAGTFWRVWHADLGGASPLLCEPAS